ncbi:hypothetical protein OXE08_004532 [Salmonella enterica]|nr:hypothetical protein [Salmonella enterica]
MKKSLLISVLLAFSVPAMAQTHMIKSWGYNGELYTVGEMTTAQGEQGLSINLQGLGDHVFTPTDAGAWNGGKPGKRLFIQHWKCSEPNHGYLTVETFTHEDLPEMDLLISYGKDIHTSITAQLTDKY